MAALLHLLLIMDKTIEKAHWHVASYTSEMGWFVEYDGTDEKEARRVYRECKKIYPKAVIEKR